VAAELDYRALFDGVADGLVVHDPETGEIVDANDAYCELHGYSREELLELDVTDLTADDWDPPASPETLVTDADTRGQRTFEWQNQRADGEPFWVEVTLSRVETGGASYVLASVRDISDRKAVEERVNRYETFVENAGDGMYVFDTDGTIEYVNRRVVETTGVPREAWVGDTVDVFTDRGLTNDPPVDAFREALASFVADDAEHRRIEIESPNGVFEATEIRLSAVREDGELESVVATVRDVSERRRYEDELERRTEQMEVLNRVVRHDIRNDMTVVLAWLEELETHVDDAGRDSLQRVLRASEHVVELTDIAREHVEVVVGERDVDRRPIRVAETLREEVERRRESYPGARIDLETPLPAATVLADDMLSSVFRNLINNAVQHNDKDTPVVTVTATETGDTVTVRVADNGPGVPDDQKEQIFGKGDRGLDSPGSGIGLYLVHTLVEGYGGAVHVADNEPDGAVFVVELPAA
jgi:PAS domain S-box-containing protein